MRIFYDSMHKWKLKGSNSCRQKAKREELNLPLKWNEKWMKVVEFVCVCVCLCMREYKGWPGQMCKISVFPCSCWQWGLRLFGIPTRGVMCYRVQMSALAGWDPICVYRSTWVGVYAYLRIVLKAKNSSYRKGRLYTRVIPCQVICMLFKEVWLEQLGLSCPCRQYAQIYV